MGESIFTAPPCGGADGGLFRGQSGHPRNQPAVSGLNIFVYLAFVIFYKLLTSGHIRPVGVVTLMFLAAVAILGYDSRAALLSGQWPLYLGMLPDLLMLLGGLLTALAIRPHLDGAYHPTWGDRCDGRRVRTIPPMSVVVPYIMVDRTAASNFIFDELEVTDLEAYVREKRREGLTNFGLTHVFITAYCRLVAKYPALNRFLSGQRVYSRGTISSTAWPSKRRCPPTRRIPASSST